MRLVLIQGMLTGIGGAILFFAIWLKSVEVFVAASVPVAIVVLVSVIQTFFKEQLHVGYVHPDDLLFGNIFAFLFVLALILGAGYYYTLGLLAPLMGTDRTTMATAMFNYASVIFVAFIFLWGLSQLGWILEVISGKGRELTKEVTARFILFALILGVVMSMVLAGFNTLYMEVGFNMSALILGGAALIILIILGIFLRGRYEELPPGP